MVSLVEQKVNKLIRDRKAVKSSGFVHVGDYNVQRKD